MVTDERCAPGPQGFSKFFDGAQDGLLERSLVTACRQRPGDDEHVSLLGRGVPGGDIGINQAQRRCCPGRCAPVILQETDPGAARQQFLEDQE